MKSFKTTMSMASFAIFLILSINSSLCQAQAHHGWHKAGSQPNDYEMKIVSDVNHDGNGSAIIRSTSESIDGFGTYMQTFKADKYHGKRLKLSAWIKTEDVNSAHLWMRLDGKQDMTGFDNMDDRPIKGTTDWKLYSIVLDIPDETVFIAFGAFIKGTGTIWVDDYTFENVGDDTPTTNMLTGEPPEKTEEQKEQYEKQLKRNFPDEPDNLGCDI